VGENGADRLALRYRLLSVAAQNHCAFDQYPDGGLYFTRLQDAEYNDHYPVIKMATLLNYRINLLVL
jgi:hypothetical protein